MENHLIYQSQTSPRRAPSNTSQLKLDTKEQGFSPSTPTPSLLGKPYTMGSFSWDHACVQKRGGARDVMKHLGPGGDEGLRASDTHKRNYEKNPRRKMREAGRGIECDRKRKRDKKDSETIGRKRPKEARVQGHMLKRVLSPGNSRDRLTLPPTNKTGLFKKGRASRLVKSGLSDLVFSEMRFLAATGGEQVALDRGRSVSRGEERFCRPHALEISRSDRAQKVSDIAHPDKLAQDRKGVQGKIKDRALPTKLGLLNASHRTLQSPHVSSLDREESTSNPCSGIRDYFDTRKELLSSVNLAGGRVMPGRRSEKKPKSTAMNASAARTPQGLSGLMEEGQRNRVPGQPQVASESPTLRTSERRGTPRKEGNGELLTQEYLGRRTGCSNDGEYKKVWE
ncbi:hypothetical protein HOY80DRAFT_887659 [Tuber brumale]|nr:hypothetical protein HOY80DRAFT_887659 [Tuber brumale]